MDEANRAAATIRFGVFEVDLRSGELRKAGVRIKLQEQPFKVLAALLERPGEVVAREELRRRIWPNEEFGDFDHAVNMAVAKLRTALGDSAEVPRIIETLHRRGYRLIVPIRTSQPGTPPITTAAPVASPPAQAVSESVGLAISSDSTVQVRPLGSEKSSALHNWKQALTFAAIVTVAIGLSLYRWAFRSRVPSLQNAVITKLTDGGTAAYAAISPDGRYVVYALRSGEKLSLRVRQVATPSDVEVLPPDDLDFQGLSFSPDGNYIYFVRSDRNLPIYKSLYRMPVLGGPARLLIKDVDCPVSFSPDGHQLVFTRGNPRRMVTEVLVANADGSGEHVLAAFPDGDPSYNPGATWSPDGRTIAVSVHVYGKQSRFILGTASVKDGSIAELYSSAYPIGRPVWLPDGGNLLVPLWNPSALRGQLWTISYPQGKLRRLTNDLADYDVRIDLTRDGRILSAIQTDLVSNIWMSPATDLSRARQITFSDVPFFRVAEAADKKLLAQNIDGRLWIMNADGSQRTLFVEARDTILFTPCGRFVLFMSLETGTKVLTRVEADGANPTPLLSGDVSQVTCSADGKFIFYLNFAHPQKISRMPVEGGPAVEIAGIRGESIASDMSMSPDGKRIAYIYAVVNPLALKLAAVSVDGGSTAELWSVPGGTRGVRWSRDGQGLQYLLTRDGATNIWEQRLAGGEPRQVTKFTSGEIFDFNWSPDYKRLLLTRGSVSSDVVLLSDFR